jgi:hypothetical protein
MANQGIIHLSVKMGGRPYCGSRRAIMCTTEDRIKADGWTRVCVKCEAIRAKFEARRLNASKATS